VAGDLLLTGELKIEPRIPDQLAGKGAQQASEKLVSPVPQ